jgi:pilus assembly protein CpaF
VQFPIRALRSQIAAAINVIIHLERHEDGKRRVTSLQEINGLEGDVLTTTEIFAFHREGIDDQGAVLGGLRPTGIVPGFLRRIKQRGIGIPIKNFQHASEAGDQEP